MANRPDEISRQPAILTKLSSQRTQLIRPYQSHPMFSFFRKKKIHPRTEAFNEVSRKLGTAEGSLIDAAIVLIHAKGAEGLIGLLNVSLMNKLFLPLKVPGDLSSACLVVEGGSRGYFALFSTEERALRFLEQEAAYTAIAPVDLLGILFNAAEPMGMILNPTDEHVTYTITPPNMEVLRRAVRETFTLKPGNYYWVNGDDPKVVKLLAVDEQSVHLRMYSNRFDTAPESIDPEALSLSNEGSEKVRAVGHLPVSRDHFFAWSPRHLQEGTVAAEELEGFLVWKEAKGGYF